MQKIANIHWLDVRKQSSFSNISKIQDNDFSSISKRAQEHRDLQSMILDRFWLKQQKRCFTKMRFSQSRTVHLFYIVQSSNHINRYIPSYLRVAWWATGLSKTKRITKQIPKISFSVARECTWGRQWTVNPATGEGLVEWFRSIKKKQIK